MHFQNKVSHIFSYEPDFEMISDELRDYGFSVMPEIIEEDYVTELGRVVGTQDFWHKTPNDFHGKNAFLVPNLINKSPSCIDVVCDKNILSIATDFFRSGAFDAEEDVYQLHLMHGRVIQGKAPAQELHIDSRCCGINPPSHLHFFLYLDDCTSVGDGATRFVPGSHKFDRYSVESDNTKATEVYGKKGSLIVLNSATFHGSSRKTTAGERKLLTFAFSRWFIRHPFAIPYFKSWPRQLTNEEKSLFGFYNYGPTDDDPRLSARGRLPNLVARNDF